MPAPDPQIFPFHCAIAPFQHVVMTQIFDFWVSPILVKKFTQQPLLEKYFNK
jgi:hypothetical protein